MDADFGPGSYDICAIAQLYEEVSIYQIMNVLNEEAVTEVENEVANVPLELNSSDLCQFRQSENLDRIDVEEDIPLALKKLLHFLKTTVRQTAEELFHVETKSNITATISKYSKGDYLLCHDDLMGSRAVAFVLYISHLTEEDGGTLRFFDHDSTDDPISNRYNKKIRPLYNSLVLFRVNKTSHHEVEQMFTDAERVSINGWFHYESDDDDDDDVIILTRVCKSPVVNLTMPVNPIMELKKIIAPTLMSSETVSKMKQHFRANQETAIAIDDVLNQDFFQNCVLELETSTELMWDEQGPANYRFYETIPFDVEGPHISFGEGLQHINNLVDLLVSEAFLSVLAEVTGIEYAVFEIKYVPPASMIEVQRWREGHYSLLTDNNVERDTTSIEVTIFFKVNSKMIGSAQDDTDMSGIIVQSSRSPALSRNGQKLLHTLKMRRIQECGIWKNGKATRAQKKEMKRILIAKASDIVQEKITKLQSYRKSRPAEVLYLTPKDNSMIITIGSKNVIKYTSYIKKKDASSEPEVGFYAVNVTYFTA